MVVMMAMMMMIMIEMDAQKYKFTKSQVEKFVTCFCVNGKKIPPIHHHCV
jgi:hypothetical protein